MSPWTPALGDVVWMNYPDADEPEGEVVGFMAEGERRAGQPIIARLYDRAPFPPFDPGYVKGDRVVIAPAFLLPFRFGGPQWKAAESEDRIGAEEGSRTR